VVKDESVRALTAACLLKLDPQMADIRMPDIRWLELSDILWS